LRLESLSKPKYERIISPLYGIKSRKRLAEVLHWTGGVKALEDFARQPDNYNCFITKTGKKPRSVQEPKPKLKALHQQIARLILRIDAPSYLHSGLRKRSYVTNARQHVNDMPAVTLDIVNFFTSTLHSHVTGFFKNKMKCAPDVAGLLSSLSCVNVGGILHLPTGSPLSQILAFHAHTDMFDALNTYVMDRDGKFTVYVDDMTASMMFASTLDIRRMGRIVVGHGLSWHKARFFPKGHPKTITGAIARATLLQAPKKQHLKYAETRDLVGRPEVPPYDQLQAAKSAIGILQSIAQVDERQMNSARGMKEKFEAVVQAY